MCARCAIKRNISSADMPKKYEKLKMNSADKLPINVNAADVLAINANSDTEMINSSKSTQMALCNLNNSISPAIHVQLPLYTLFFIRTSNFWAEAECS